MKVEIIHLLLVLDRYLFDLVSVFRFDFDFGFGTVFNQTIKYLPIGPSCVVFSIPKRYKYTTNFVCLKWSLVPQPN